MKKFTFLQGFPLYFLIGFSSFGIFVSLGPELSHAYPGSIPLVPELNPKIAPQPTLDDPDQYLPQGVSQLIIRLGERRVYVYSADEVQTSYPIAVGKSGWETPTGRFEIIQMIRDPAWEHPWNGTVVPPGPNNPLGDRWIGFWSDGINYIGFHGTPAEELVGQAVSHGCIRMRNADVRTLFELVSLGTPVIVEP